ncbi:MAG: aldo/keto reductase [Deltaproteobacteria bacterium]|nr:aldo/keto reductase [Deltaproteobacteria bacterium]MBW2136605.1 aldo/keto reductase [Deltaproteobacteria bacterium]
MEYRSLGRTGLEVSCLAFGTDNFLDPTPERESTEMLNRALDAGVNLLDTGDIYAGGEGEEMIGRALKANGRRHEVLLCTKVDHGMSQPGVSLDNEVPVLPPNRHGNSRYNIIRACENSLRKFQTDYIDIYIIHRPSWEIPIDETLRALDDLVRQGKVRYIGCSTFPAWAIMESFLISRELHLNRFVVEEAPYNLLDRRIENELIPMAQKYGMGIIPYLPMAMGVLAGRYSDAKKYPKGSRAEYRGGFYKQRVTQKGIETAGEFAKIARRIGISPAQLALLWVKDQPGVTAPLMGPRTIEQLEELLPVAEMTLDDQTRAACDELVPPGSVVSDYHNTAYWMKMKVL